MEKQIPKNEAPSNWNIETLKEYLYSLIYSNDRRYQESFAAAEKAVAAALAAQKELTNAAFASSEKAIVKAEDAQRDYNVRSNEFRGQLDDQAQTLMPRTETHVLIKSVEDKIGEITKTMDTMTGRVTTIESRGIGKTEAWQYIVAGIGVILGLVGIISFIISQVKK